MSVKFERRISRIRGLRGDSTVLIPSIVNKNYNYQPFAIRVIRTLTPIQSSKFNGNLIPFEIFL